MKTIAIIGSNGMLGSDLVRYLSLAFEVTPINKENYAKHVGDSFDIVVNANGNSKRFWANKHPLEDFTASTLSVYKSIVDFKYQMYAYISSSDVYENHGSPLSTSEDKIPTPENLSSYGLHKYLSEMIVRANAKEYIILRASLILGKDLKKGPFYDILNKNPLFITRDSKLQLVTTAEVANVIRFLLEHEVKRETFNMGGIGSFSFENIEDYFKMSISFSDSGEKQEYEMNVTKLKTLFPLKTSKEYLKEFVGDSVE